MGRKTRSGSRLSIFCIVLALSLGAVGVGYAAWQEGLAIGGTVATGDIDPVFTRCEVVGESCSPSRAAALVVADGKRVLIQVHDAYPGYYVRFRYRVTNQGTVPVRFETETHSTDPAVELELSAPAGVIDGRGGFREGDLSLTVGGAEESKTYDFTVELLFRQWNAGI